MFFVINGNSFYIAEIEGSFYIMKNGSSINKEFKNQTDAFLELIKQGE